MQDILFGFAQNLALLMALVLGYSLTLPLGSRTRAVQVVINGLLFGAAAVLCMQVPIHMAEGVHVDNRIVVMALVVPFAGWRAGLVACGLAAAYRWYLGGMGTWPGIASLVSTMIAGGLVAGWLARCGRDLAWQHLPLLGALSVVVTLPWTFTLPAEADPVAVFRRFALPLTIVYPAGVMVLGLMLLHVSRTHRLGQSLAASERRFRTLFDHAPDAILVADPDTGLVTDANPRACELLGRTRCDLIGIHQRDLHPDTVHTEAERVFREHVRHTIAAGRPTSPQAIAFLGPDGEEVPVEVVAQRMEDEDGPRLIGFFRDMREQLAMKEQLRHSEQMRLVGQLAGGVAHDFNNHLQIISSFASLALEGSDRDQADPQLRRALEAILSSSASASKLTAQLLSFSRRQVVRPRPVCLHQIVEEVRELLARSLPKRIALRCELNAARSCIYADPDHLKNALLNLALNARDAMPEGGELLLRSSDVTTVDDPGGAEQRVVLPAPSGPRCRLELIDGGAGMSPEVLAHAFEPFYTTKPTGAGTGLGLAAVYGILEEHDAGLAVSSRAGHGTTFAIDFACCDEAEGCLVGGAGADSGRRSASAVGRARILAVDDEELIGEVLLGGLAAAFDLRFESDPLAAEAIFAADPQSIDLLLVDLNMPRLDGGALARRCLERRPDLPVVLATGLGPQAVDQALLANERVSVITKPFAIADLRRHLAERLAER